jgi:general secretion pathway protein L
MLTVTCDLGTYSIKILESRQDAGKIVHIQAWEIPLDSKLFQAEPIQNPNTKIKIDLGLWKILETTRVQLQQLEDYLLQLPDNTKIIFQAPYELMSSRFKMLPAKNLKSAKLMLPFQIEEEIPYALAETHLVSVINKKEDAFWAFALFAKTENFESFYQLLKDSGKLPNILAHESSGFNLLGKDLRPLAGEGNYCILDMGHTMTKAYFYTDQMLVASFVSYVAGSKIDEMLTGFYKISETEARDFKHDTAFILPRSQFTQDLTADQKVFAENLDDLMIPFVNEFKLWELSYRVAQGKNIDRIFLCGGASRLRNMENYLSFHFNRPVEYLSDGEGSFTKSKISPKELPTYFTAHALSKTAVYAAESGNLLNKQYQSPRQQPFPLHAVAFVSWRYLAVCLVVTIILMGHLFLIQNKDKKLTAQLRPMLNNPLLNLPADQKNMLVKRPEQLLKKLQEKKTTLNQEIKHFKSLSSVNHLEGLSRLHSALPNKTTCVLSQFDSSARYATANFSLCNTADKETLRKDLEKSALSNLKVNANGDNLQAEFEF